MNDIPLRGKRARRKNGDELLNEYEAADFLGLSVHWLRMSRLAKPKWAGPKYIKLDGYHVRYDPEDLRDFKASRNGGPRIIDPAERMREAS